MVWVLRVVSLCHIRKLRRESGEDNCGGDDADDDDDDHHEEHSLFGGQSNEWLQVAGSSFEALIAMKVVGVVLIEDKETRRENKWLFWENSIREVNFLYSFLYKWNSFFSSF